MKINNSVKARFLSYSIGLIIQVAIIFLLTAKLEIYQFGLWGISMSFIFILSTASQMSYFQNIEKYFPNYSLEKKHYFLIKYIKTIFIVNPIILLFLFLTNYFGYFEKFNIENINYLLIMIAFLSTIESCLVILDGYSVATRNSKIFDSYDLFIYKVPRFFIFYLLLNSGYSVFYLIFATILLRSLLLMSILIKEFKNLSNFFKFFKNNSVFNENFQNIKYSLSAFGNKSLYLSFINILFLITSNSLISIDIAHYSLMVIILNNLRPIMSTIPSLLSPIISSSIKKNIDLNYEIKNIEIINQILISVFLLFVLTVVQFNDLFSIFFAGYFDGIYKLIFLSAFASTLNSMYYTKYLKQLFSKKERDILKFNCLNYTFCIFTFYLIYKFIYLINFIYIFIFYEILFFLYINYLNNNRKNFIPNVRDFSLMYLSSIFIASTYIFDIFSFYLYLIIPLGLIFDFKVIYKKIDK